MRADKTRLNDLNTFGNYFRQNNYIFWICNCERLTFVIVFLFLRGFSEFAIREIRRWGRRTHLLRAREKLRWVLNRTPYNYMVCYFTSVIFWKTKKRCHSVIDVFWVSHFWAFLSISFRSFDAPLWLSPNDIGCQIH